MKSNGLSLKCVIKVLLKDVGVLIYVGVFEYVIWLLPAGDHAIIKIKEKADISSMKH